MDTGQVRGRVEPVATVGALGRPDESDRIPMMQRPNRDAHERRDGTDGETSAYLGVIEGSISHAVQSVSRAGEPRRPRL
ncbi:hypothetical protein GCM10023319_67760 [Nocardia iowensis]